jgi:hypothetical protein
MAKQRKLRPGKGAKGSVLTRFIKPNQHVPYAGHRSDVIIESRLTDEEGRKEMYSFRYEGMPESQVLYASARYVRIEEEGEIGEIFDDPEGEQGEGKVPWANSKARTLLYNDVLTGTIPLERGTISLENIYTMHPEFSKYDFDKFDSRLTGIRKIVSRLNQRANADQKAFQRFVKNHDVSFYSHKGYPQWKGSIARKHVLEDIANGEHKKGFRQMYIAGGQLYGTFPFEDFCDKVRQEIRTSKYIHTLEATGKTHKAS